MRAFQRYMKSQNRLLFGTKGVASFRSGIVVITAYAEQDQTKMLQLESQLHLVQNEIVVSPNILTPECTNDAYNDPPNNCHDSSNTMVN